MASAWGGAFGAAWGNSWGAFADAAVVPSTNYGGKRKQISGDDDLVDLVLEKWAAIEASTAVVGEQAPEVAALHPVLPAIEPAASIEQPFLPVVLGNPVSAAALSLPAEGGAVLGPAAALAAIEARRRNDEDALMLILMEA